MPSSSQRSAPRPTAAPPRKVAHADAENPGYLIRRLQQLSSSNFMSSLRDYQLTPVQYTILRVLEERPGIDQRTVASVAALDTSTTTDVLKRLAGRKLVSRTAGPTDRRTRIIRLTKAGERLLQTVRPIVEAARLELLSPLSPERQEALLEAIIDLLAAHERDHYEEEPVGADMEVPVGRPWKRLK